MINQPDGSNELFDFRIDWGLSTNTETNAEIAKSLFEALCGTDLSLNQEFDTGWAIERGQQEKRLLRYGEKLLRFTQTENLERPKITRTETGLTMVVKLQEEVEVQFDFQLPTVAGGRIGMSYALDTASPSENHREWMERAIASLRPPRRKASHATA